MTALPEIQKRICQASAANTPLQIRGGGSKDWYGQTSCGEILDLSGYHGIVEYEPTELVMIVKAGTLLRTIQTELAANHQFLAFEPPAFSAHSTIGGVVAAGLAGPRRVQSGGIRDFMLGVSLLSGRGELLRFGGKVMKNVAGYDVSRLLVGSLGVLGVITEVSLKVLPIPLQEQTLLFHLDESTALRQLNQWAGQPLPISASSWCHGELSVRLSGAPSGLAAACAKLGGELLEPAQAERFWQAIRDQRLPFFTYPRAGSLWRLSVPSSAPALNLGEPLIEWGGAQRWLWSDLAAAELRAKVSAVGGHATLFRTDNPNNVLAKEAGVFQALSTPLAAIHQRLKRVFDPTGILNRGRMYPDW